MKDIRCSFSSHFYISVPDDATPDEIEHALNLYISDLETYVNDYFAIDEYDWSEANV